MYEHLTLENFKGFQELDLGLKPLTMLSGMNGMGKSSVLQSLLLLRQSYLQRTGITTTGESLGLVLNGDLVELGTGQDIRFDRVDYVQDTDEMSIMLKFDEFFETTWRYRFDSQSDVLEPINNSKTSLSDDVYTTSLFTDNFHYLRAERVGPRAAFQMSDYMVSQRNQIGPAGEYTAHFLQVNRDKPITKSLMYPKSTTNTLLAQVTAWMGMISPETRIEIQEYSDMDMMSLRFGFPGTKSFRSTNVGFGITYTLPILVAILSSSPGSLLLLENPEAHLHPRGQSRIGELLAIAASSGVQIILETHSDHILNGIRIAARNQVVDPNLVALHFFQRPTSDSSVGVEVLTPTLDADGRLDFWPDGFFDEWDRSLDELL